MNIFRLLQVASVRLATNDALFHEQADTVLGILRSAGVLPFKGTVRQNELETGRAVS